MATKAELEARLRRYERMDSETTALVSILNALNSMGYIAPQFKDDRIKRVLQAAAAKHGVTL